jgi:phage shock protein A
MPQSLLDKARVAVLGNLHELLDRAVDTPEGYRQYTRDLESALADLRAAHDEVVGTVNGYKRDVEKLQTDNASKQSDIDLLLGDNDPSNDESAVQLQMRLEQNNEQIDTLNGLITTAEQNKIQLEEAINKLENKHLEMANNLNRITLSAAATKAQNRASSAAEGAMEASNAASGASIDNIESKIDHQRDVADARFARVFNQLEGSATPEEEARLARARAALEARRAEIAGQAKEAAKEPAAT